MGKSLDADFNRIMKEFEHDPEMVLLDRKMVAINRDVPEHRKSLRNTFGAIALAAFMFLYGEAAIRPITEVVAEGATEAAVSIHEAFDDFRQLPANIN